MSEKDQWLLDNPEWEQVHMDMAALVRGGVKKPDDTFRDILRQRKKRHPRSNINVP